MNNKGMHKHFIALAIFSWISFFVFSWYAYGMHGEIYCAGSGTTVECTSDFRGVQNQFSLKYADVVERDTIPGFPAYAVRADTRLGNSYLLQLFYSNEKANLFADTLNDIQSTDLKLYSWFFHARALYVIDFFIFFLACFLTRAAIVHVRHTKNGNPETIAIPAKHIVHTVMLVRFENGKNAKQAKSELSTEAYALYTAILNEPFELPFEFDLDSLEGFSVLQLQGAVDELRKGNYIGFAAHGGDLVQ